MGSKNRGQIPLGWTISPGLNELASPIIAYLKETRTPNDDFVGAPSGLGYVYPATWHEAKFNAFARMTGEYLSETFLALGNNSQKRGPLNIIGAGNLVSPNMSALQALLQQDSVEGLFWYTFGAGYSGWNGTIFARKSKKPVIGGRISLWGNASSGTMLGVHPMIEYFKMQLRKRIINTNASDVNGYSLVPVNVWSHR